MHQYPIVFFYYSFYNNFSHLTKAQSVADIGCGSGLMTLCYLLAGAKNVLAYDLDIAMAKKFQKL